MSEQPNYVITNKVIGFTGNEETKAFIGESVRKVKANNGGVVWAIGKTGYVLTNKEFKMFAMAGVIANKITRSKSTQKAAEIAAAERKAQARAAAMKERKASRIDDFEPLAAVSTKQAAKSEAIAGLQETEKKSSVIAANPTISAERANALKTSAFFESYPDPDFKIEVPDKVGFFDKTADIGEKLTGFFGKLGHKNHDKKSTKISTPENE